jgi:hypothetical protein
MAGGLGKWTRLTPLTQANIAEPGYARTDDDSLQVLWVVPNAANSAHQDLFRSNITSNGTLIGSNPVETDWLGISSPALVTEEGGLHLDAFFGGQMNDQPNSASTGLIQTFSEDRGEQWQRLPGTRAEGGGVESSPMAATRLGDVFWQAWGGSGYGVFTHRGVQKSVASVNVHDRIGGGCCGYDTNIAGDPASDVVKVVWYSNTSDTPGVWSQGLDPATGNPVGEPARMPGTESASQLSDRTPLAVLSGGGIFAAYPSGPNVLVWRVGEGSSRKVGVNVASVAGTTLAATADNRLWLAWSANVGGVRRVVARRSNAGATKWGQPVTVKPPPGTTTFWSLYGEGNPGGVLDVLALVTTSGGIATWHSQVEPGLTLTASPAKVKRSKKTKVQFKVTDAGDPVKGAKVKAAGKSGKTGAGGTVSLKLGKFGKKAKLVIAKATHDGYAPGQTGVVVKK